MAVGSGRQGSTLRAALGKLWRVMTVALAGLVAAPVAADAPKRGLALPQAVWTGDLDGMIERRLVRIAVPYSRSLYYHDGGRERGLTAEGARQFEIFLNKKHRKALARRPVTILVIPTTRDQLIPALLEGRADIAAGNITITEPRRARVDFSWPVAAPFAEIVVTGPRGPALNSLDDLAGKEVFARPTTSYFESLVELNERFRRAGQAQMRIVELPDPIEDEDKLDMVNAGLLGAVVVDSWVAELWRPILPGIRLHEDLVVRPEGEAAWAFRKNSPKLEAEINEFIVKVARKSGLGDGSRKAFAAKVRKAGAATSETAYKRFESLVSLFRKYGEMYRFDYLMLTAQGYQESQLNQNARSAAGAIGIMQLMPATGAEMKVGDIKIAENNIHAGAKYMDRLIATYFPDATLDEENRTLFAFAAYNAGPGRVARLRKRAAKEGYDPDKWFNNVERVTAKRVGQEPVTYVRNIFKYYVSYKLAVEAEKAAREARADLDPAMR